MGTGLTRYEAACAALAAARQVDEVKDIRDQAEAMRAYARMANDVELELDAAELRLRAERRLGEMMAAQRDAGALSSGGRPGRGKDGRRAVRAVDAPPSLAEVGINKSLANRARQAARLDKVDFDAAVAAMRQRIRDGDRRVSVVRARILRRDGATVPTGPTLSDGTQIQRLTWWEVGRRIADCERDLALLKAVAAHAVPADDRQKVGDAIAAPVLAKFAERLQ